MTTPRSPENTPDNAFVEIARLKSMSTKEILLKLAHAPLIDKGIDIKETDPVVITIAKFEAHTAQAKIKLTNKKFDNAKGIEDVCNIIQANIDQLAKIKSTIPLSNGFSQELSPLKADVIKIIANRDSLFGELEKLLADKNNMLSTLISQLIAKTIPKEDIITQIKSLQAKQDNITAQTEKLLVNEKALRPKLEALEYKAVSAAAVAGVAIKETVTEQQTPTKP